MKKLILFLFAVTLLSSCGKDGEDGNVYIRFNWDWYVDAFEDNNPDTPNTINKDDNYLTEPGEYTFTYWCSDFYDSWYWEGTYEVIANEGTEGGLIADGEDGEDNYYLFNMTGLGGATLTLTDVGMENGNQIMSNKVPFFIGYEAVPEGDVVVETVHSTSGIMIIKKQKYLLVKK